MKRYSVTTKLVPTIILIHLVNFTYDTIHYS